MLIDPAEIEEEIEELRSLLEVRAYLGREGDSIAAWAIERKFNPSLAYAILAGRRKCVRGQSFRIANALRLNLPAVRKEAKKSA